MGDRKSKAPFSLITMFGPDTQGVVIWQKANCRRGKAETEHSCQARVCKFTSPTQCGPHCRGDRSLPVHLSCCNTLSWVISAGPPASLWFLDYYHFGQLHPSHRENLHVFTSCLHFHSAHMVGLQAPSAHQHVHLASVPLVTSSSHITQRSFWPSHLQV